MDNEKVQTEPFLTTKEAVERYRVSRQTLWRMTSKGLPCYRIGSRILYKASEVDTFIRREG